jgi:hypothetical protein
LDSIDGNTYPYSQPHDAPVEALLNKPVTTGETAQYGKDIYTDRTYFCVINSIK